MRSRPIINTSAVAIIVTNVRLGLDGSDAIIPRRVWFRARGVVVRRGGGRSNLERGKVAVCFEFLVAAKNTTPGGARGEEGYRAEEGIVIFRLSE